jgi:hypothetical protein
MSNYRSLISPTVQAASLAGLSNLLAQGIKAYSTNHSIDDDSKPASGPALDYTSLLQFIVFSLLTTPPNVIWQEFLEDKFPTFVGDRLNMQDVRSLHKGNTAAKFALDQTIGATVNGLLFIMGIGGMKGKSLSTIWAECEKVRDLVVPSLPPDSSQFSFHLGLPSRPVFEHGIGGSRELERAMTEIERRHQLIFIS